MTTKPEALPIVAYAVLHRDGSLFSLEFTPEAAYGLAEGPWGETVKLLTDYAKAAAQLSALQDEMQKRALQHLTSEGEWIALTGKLQDEVERLRADAERLDWLEREGCIEIEREAFLDGRPRCYNLLDGFNYHARGAESLRAAIDQARLAQTGGA